MFEGYWENVTRYCRYFISIILGVLLSIFMPLAPLYKRPITAIATTSLLIASFAFVFFTLRAMLGLS